MEKDQLTFQYQMRNIKNYSKLMAVKMKTDMRDIFVGLFLTTCKWVVKEKYELRVTLIFLP